MEKNLRILYLKDPTPANTQEQHILEKQYDVRTVLNRQELESSLTGFSPHVLLCGLASTISPQEVLEVLNLPHDNSLVIISIVGGNLKNILPLLRSSCTHLKTTQSKRKNEEEAREVEERYRSIYQTSLDGILVTQPDGTILSANPAACHMLEMTEEEICRAGCAGIVDTNDPRLAIALSQREKTGRAYTELTFIKKSGLKFPVELTSSVFQDAKGKPKTTIILRDVTGRKDVEEQLKASYDSYKTIFYNSPVPYWIYDQDTREIVDVNEVAIKNYGYTREEFLGLSILDLRPNEDIPKLEKHLKKISTKKGLTGHRIFNHLKKDGTPIKVQVFGYKFEYGQRNCRLVACIDITEKEDALTRLEQKRARLAAAQAIARFGYWEWDITSHTLFFSDMMYRIWGLEKSTHNTTWSFIKNTIHQEDLDKFLRSQEDSIQKGKKHQVEYRILRPSGEIKWIHERGRVLTWEGNKPKTVERTVQDITEQKTYIEKLITSEARYKGIVKSQSNYLIRMNLQGSYTYYNNKFLLDFGWLYGANEILGQSFLSSILEYHHNAVNDLVKRCVLAPGKAFQIEIDKPGKRGRVRTTLWDFVCLVNADGVPAEIQCVGIDISARIKTEKQLRDTQLRYQLVTEATSDAIWDWDLTSGNLYWSKSLESMFGYDPKNYATLEAWEQIVHPEDSPRVLDELKNAIEGTSKKWFTEYRLKKNDGEYSFVIEKGTILRDNNGKAFRLVGALQDITEKRKLQNLLQKANKLSRIGSFDLDLVNEILYWSPMTKEIHEVSQDFTPDLETAIYFYKKGISRNKIQKALRKAIERHKSFDVELQIVTAKGKALWVRVIAEPEVENGKCVRVNGSFQDIDKIKQAEKEIFIAAKEKDTLLDSIGDAFFAVDNNWVVTYWNKHAATLLHCPKQNILKQKFWDVFADVVGTVFHRNYEATMEDKKMRQFEGFFERTSAWYEVTVYPSHEGLSVFFKDISKRKTAEVKLRELNKSLKAHTRELVTANKGLEQFSYIVSHNLRSPVANILGLADLLQNSDYPKKVREKFFSEIFLNVERLDSIVKDLNNILQVKVDVKATRERIDLQELVDGISSSIKNLIRDEKAEIRCDFQKNPEITTVKSYLYSIFYNLIVNSIKYRRPEVPPVIEINAITKGEFIILSFKDNGLGIDLSNKGDQIFNLYKRFHHHVEGKGMGLFMVKSQVEMLGGKISLESRVNNGSTFTIVFKENVPIEEEDNGAVMLVPNNR